MSSPFALLTTVSNQPGMLFAVTEVLTRHRADIAYVDIIQNPDKDPQIYLEFTLETSIDDLASALRQVPGIKHVEVTPSLERIYGKRIIVMGGGAQVGQVALGAIAEADRHNIRG